MKKFAIILAAGKGTRMKSTLENKSKVSYEILGVPLVKYVLNTLKDLNVNKIVTVVGFGGDTTKTIVENESCVVWQKEQKGTGHAVMQAKSELENSEGCTIVLCGDTPLLKSETLNTLFEEHIKQNNKVTVLGAKVPNPNGYGRLIINCNNQLEKIVEHKDATDEEKKIDIVNTGVYIFDNELLFKYINEIKCDNNAGEFYLTDLIEIFRQKGHRVGASLIFGDEEMLGINDRVQLAYASKLMKQRINNKHMLAGVTLEDPETTYIGPNVIIGADTVIKPGVSILGNTTIGQRNIIGPNSYLENMEIGDDNNIIMSHLVDSKIGLKNNIGPFCRMRGGAIVEQESRAGNFVELKGAHLHKGAKTAHLTYLGDCEIGEKTNIGCGTITANYDGYNKSRTTIGNNVFIGSGSILIAPINIKDDAFVAAGSTLTHDVENDDLAIARARQENKKGYSHILKGRAKAKKEASLKK